MSPSCDGDEERCCKRRKGTGISQLALVFPHLCHHPVLCAWRSLNRSTWAVLADSFRLGCGCLIALLVAGPSLRLFGLGPMTSVRDSMDGI